ncbi:UNKNOWN [Stylonychia lemnae]|uniref:Transmembrane protein n=1 Tax=Stylonychia lemnae TaxID=5949 RepID=A0A077ZZR4_STYLE|nr:UNKNOWN [Stylonychia lemnae]|eukprot:CDW75112.1 UNKNOWN [Stylonychia lemnae]
MNTRERKYNKSSSCKQVIRNIDIYAKPVQLTYKGSEKFKSTFGGLVSLGVICFFLSVFIYKMNDMFLKTQTQIKKNTLVSISNQYTPPEVISDKNITFAFMLSDFYGSGAYDNPYYGDLFLTQNVINIKINQSNGESYREFLDYSIPFSKCQIGKNFFYPDPSEIKNYNIESFYCPDWLNLTIQGNWYSPEYKVVTLGFRRCQGKNCSTEDEFRQWIKKITMQEIIISSYFDVSDYENPVHYFLDDLYLPFQYNRSIVSNNYIRRNKLELHDDLFGIFNNQKDITFYQKSERLYFTSDVNEGPGEGIMFFQSFYLDKNYDIYERRVYSFSGVLQDIGGIYNTLFFAGLIIYGRFQGSIYFSSIISKLYQVEEVRKKPKKKKNDKDEESGEFNDQSGEIEPEDNLMNRFGNGFKSGIFSKRGSFLSGFSKLHEISLGIKELFLKDIREKNFSSKAYDSMKDYMKNRWRVKINFRDIFVFSFWKIFGFLRCNRRRDSDTINERKIHLYKKGEEKIKKELDCVNLMTKLRQLDLLISLELNKSQKFLLNLQKRHLIQEVETSSDEDGMNLVEVSKFDKKNQNDQTHKQFMNVLAHNLDKIQRKSKLTEIDKKILFGLITKNPHKYVENHGFRQSIKKVETAKQQVKIKFEPLETDIYSQKPRIIPDTPKIQSSSKRHLLKNEDDSKFVDQFEHSQQQQFAINGSQVSQLYDVLKNIKLNSSVGKGSPKTDLKVKEKKKPRKQLTSKSQRGKNDVMAFDKQSIVKI